MKRLIHAPVFMLTACASNTGIVLIGQDTYMVSRQAATGFSGSGSLKAEAFQEANAYCMAQGKSLQVVNAVDAQPPFVLCNYPKAEVQFTCLKASGKGMSHP